MEEVVKEEEKKDNEEGKEDDEEEEWEHEVVEGKWIGRGEEEMVEGMVEEAKDERQFKDGS